MVALLQWRDLDEMPICPIKSWPQALNANLGSISLNRDACASLCTGCRSFIEQKPPFWQEIFLASSVRPMWRNEFLKAK